MHVLAGQQLGWVWRRRTSQEQMEILVNTRWTDSGTKIGHSNLILYQQLTNTSRAILYTEQAAQGWLTDIESAKYNLFTQQGERYRQVGSQERLTLARCA